MKKTVIAILVANLFAVGTAAAADDGLQWSGSVGVGLRFNDIDGGTRNGARATSATTLAPFLGPEDKAKASEYRDLSNGLIGNIDVQGANDNYYMRFFGENFGRDDQYLNLRGGGYNNFKYQVYYGKIPHNLSWNALTPFSGTGTATLTGAPGTTAPYPPSQNPATWNRFDYGLQRDTYGGNVEANFKSPWYFKVDYNETTVNGIRPQSGRLGTSANNGFMEFGAPVDYKTQNFTVEGGYSEKRGSISVSLLNSKFSNSNDSMTWPNFFMLGQTDTNLLPPDNDLKRLGINGTLRDLPANSTLAGRYTYSKLTNGFSVLSTGLMPTSSATSASGAPTAVGLLNTTPSSSSFSGETKTQTASLSLASSWGHGVDSRLFWNYYDHKNDSTVISYALGGLGTNAAACPSPSYATSSTATNFCIGPYPNELLSYKKDEYGLDAGWRINRGNKLAGGLNYLKTEREGRDDSTETRDSKLWVEYKNSMLEDLTGRIKYQYLERRSDLDPGAPVGQNPFAGPTAPTNVTYYFRAYDVSNFNQDQIKLVADWTPIPFLDLGGEYAWKKTDYKDLLYGRTEDHRDEYNLTASYGDPRKFRISGVFNYEIVEFNQAYRNGAPAFGPSPNNAANFDWSTKNTQTNRVYGIAADWPAMERLAIKASYTWVKTGGGVDFTSGNTAGAGGFNGGPLVNYVTDNTKKESFVLKGDYKFDRQWTGTLGYTYEKYSYADDQMRGYQGFYPYYQNLGGSNISWLSGAYANPSYKVNLIWMMATYKFN